jgi:hypothetical protein
MRARSSACRLVFLALAASYAGCSKAGHDSDPSGGGEGGEAGSGEGGGGVSGDGGEAGASAAGGSAGDGGTSSGGSGGDGESGEGGTSGTSSAGEGGGNGEGGEGGSSGTSSGQGGASGAAGSAGNGGAAAMAGNGGAAATAGNGGSQSGNAGSGGKATCGITTCTNSDACCPANCTPLNDNDCMAPTYDVEVWADNQNRTYIRPTMLDAPYNSYARIRWHNIGPYELWIVNFGSGTNWSQLAILGPGATSTAGSTAEGPWCGFDIGQHRIGALNYPTDEYAIMTLRCVRP